MPVELRADERQPVRVEGDDPGRGGLERGVHGDRRRRLLVGDGVRTGIEAEPAAGGHRRGLPRPRRRGRRVPAAVAAPARPDRGRRVLPRVTVGRPPVEGRPGDAPGTPSVVQMSLLGTTNSETVTVKPVAFGIPDSGGASANLGPGGRGDDPPGILRTRAGFAARALPHKQPFPIAIPLSCRGTPRVPHPPWNIPTATTPGLAGRGQPARGAPGALHGRLRPRVRRRPLRRSLGNAGRPRGAS